LGVHILPSPRQQVWQWCWQSSKPGSPV
jgi:hypothetical protein